MINVFKNNESKWTLNDKVAAIKGNGIKDEKKKLEDLEIEKQFLNHNLYALFLYPMPAFRYVRQ